MFKVATSWIIFAAIAASAWATEPVATTQPAAPPDLSQLDRGTLLVLCSNLYERVGQLEAELRAAHAGPSPKELQQRIDTLEAALGLMRQQNHALRLELAEAKQQATETQAALAERRNPPEESPPADAAPRWSYRYKTYLISESGTGRMEIRYDDGDKEKLDINYEYYRTDAIAFQCDFKNTSSVKRKYQFEIRVAERRVGSMFAGSGPPTIVGRAVYKTPYLAPGEIHSFEIPVKVPNVQKVGRAAIGNVTSIQAGG